MEAQRRESLKLHVLKLSESIDELKLQLDRDKEVTAHGSSLLDVIDPVDSTNSPLPPDKDDEAENDLAECNHDEGVPIEALSPESISEDPSSVSIHENGEVGVVANKSKLEAGCSSVYPSDRTSDSGSEESSAGTSKEMADDNLIPPIRSTDIPSRPPSLSKRDKLLLRKQALTTKKRPVLAIGRSNIITGVAKAIRTHFQKHPLAIVNVKGRAKGTSVQELIFNLEQETGAVLVSQEPSKIILYRGWGAEDETGVPNNKALGDAAGKAASPRGSARVSPELIAAIKLECGLQRRTQNISDGGNFGGGILAL